MQLELVGVDRGERVERGDDDGEEADQRDHASLGAIPKPNQNTSSGAMTTIGTAWEATSSG